MTNSQDREPSLVVIDVHDYAGPTNLFFGKRIPAYGNINFRDLIGRIRGFKREAQDGANVRHFTFRSAIEPIGLLLALAGFVSFFVAVFAFPIPKTGGPGWVHFLWTLMAPGFALVALGKFLSYSRVEIVQANDRRRPILLLHSFGDDKTTIYDAVNTYYEDELTFQLKGLGPVVAIGRPGEAITYHGAARRYVSDAEWQQAVLALMDEALLIVAVAGTTEALGWELRQIHQKGYLSKLIVALPPAGSSKDLEKDALRWQLLWQSLNSPPQLQFENRLSSRILALHFQPSGLVALWTRSRPKSDHFHRAMDLAIYGCLCHRWSAADQASVA